MSFSLNKISLIGNIGKDHETTTTPNGTVITKFSIATVDSKKVNDAWEDETTWHNIVAFKQSDFMLDKLRKGAKFYVEGKQTHQKYEKDGETKYFSSVVAYKLIPLDKGEAKQNQGIPEQNSTAADKEEPLPF